MKYLIILLSLSCGLYAGSSTCLDLAANLERGVQTIASGRIDDGLMEISEEGVGSESPKQKAERNKKFSDLLKRLGDFGATRRVVRVSLLYIGEGYCRLRVLDRRNNGAVLWTFFCERDGDRWYLTSVAATANGDFSTLMKELDAADYSKEEQKAP